MFRYTFFIPVLLVLCTGLYAGGAAEIDTRGMTLVEHLSPQDPWFTARDHARAATDLRFSREVAKSRVRSPFQSINGDYEFETAITYDENGTRHNRLVRSLKNGEPVTEEELKNSGSNLNFGTGKQSGTDEDQGTQKTGQERSSGEKEEPFDVTAEGRVWVRLIGGIESVEGIPCHVYEFAVIDREQKNPRKPSGYRGTVWISRDLAYPIRMEYSYSANDSGMAMGADVRRYWKQQGGLLVPQGADMRIQMSFLVARITMEVEQRFFDFLLPGTVQ